MSAVEAGVVGRQRLCGSLEHQEKVRKARIYLPNAPIHAWWGVIDAYIPLCKNKVKHVTDEIVQNS